MDAGRGRVARSRWLGARRLRERVVRPLQTLATCSRRCARGTTRSAARGADRRRPAGRGGLEVNALGDTLRASGWGRWRPARCSAQVMEEIDVAIFAFDGAGLAAAGQPRRASGCCGAAARAARSGATPERWGWRELPGGPGATAARRGLRGEAGPYELRRGTFRAGRAAAPAGGAGRPAAGAARGGARRRGSGWSGC